MTECRFSLKADPGCPAKPGLFHAMLKQLGIPKEAF
jgi:hypothetical protein